MSWMDELREAALAWVDRAVEGALDGAGRKLDRLQDAVDATLGDPEAQGIQRGYTRAAEEFEPLMEELEQEYQEVIGRIRETNRSYREKTEYLLGKLETLTEERDRLRGQRENRAARCGVSVQDLADLSRNPALDLGRVLVDRRVARMKKAEQAAYQEACARFDRKLAQMRERLRQCRQGADENLRERVRLVEDCLAEIAELQKQIAAADMLEAR